MELAPSLSVAQTSAQAWIEEYRALPRLHQMSKRRTVIALSASLLWVAVIRYVLQLG